MEKVYEDTITGLMKDMPSNKLIFHSFRILCPKKREWPMYGTVIAISMILAVLFSISQNTVEQFQNSVNLMLTVLLAVFATLVTGYALFQALLGKRMLSILLRVNEKGPIRENTDHDSMLQQLNENFSDNIMLILFCIFLNIILELIGFLIKPDWCLTENVWINIICSIGGIFCYLYLNLIALIDIKGFIGNIIKVFNLFAGTGIQEMVLNNEVEIISNEQTEKSVRKE